MTQTNNVTDKYEVNITNKNDLFSQLYLEQHGWYVEDIKALLILLPFVSLYLDMCWTLW